MKIVKPDYTRSIVNIMSSILQNYGARSTYEPLKELELLAKNNYENIVLMVFDGMGIKALEEHLKSDDFLLAYNRGEITSVYPSTTTAAMTSYYSGLSPAEHGWLGWSLYFKEYAKTIDIFPNCDSYSKEALKEEQIAYKQLPYTTVYQKIHDATHGEVAIHTIMPKEIYFPENPNHHHPMESLEEMSQLIKSITEGEGKKFITTYWPDPDMSMHVEGCSDDKIRRILVEINDMIEKLQSQLKHTLLIISADHGLITIKDEMNLADYPEITDCLIMPPFVESRALSFFVHQNKKALFEQLFIENFGNDYVLYTKEQTMRDGLFGPYGYHSRFNDFIGDFFACANNKGVLSFRVKSSKEPHPFKGYHAGLTEREMLIPLIIKECI